MDSCLRGNTIPLGQARWKAAILTALIVAGVLAMFALPAATTTAECQFILGFATLKALIDAAEGPDKVGDCLENQRFNPENGDALQQTTGGLLVWRKADNWTAFTDGYRTWINGPYGLQARLNTEQFDWEGPPQASPAPAIEIGAEYTAQCSNGGAVRNPQANPGLVADCAALLQGRDTLAGSAALNWRAERAIVNWEGVTVGGSPHRVTGLRLNNQFINYRPMSKTYPTDDLQPGFPFVMSGHGGFYGWGSQLTGTIPPALGALNQLETLSLGGNQLTGPIPPQLAVLNQLETLDLGDNQLAGPIPSQLGTISNLRGLFLNDNQLAGPIPPELSSLTRLQLLDLSDNRLTGPIPRQLDSLTNLLGVWLDSNQLSGSIPPQVAVLTHLRRLDLSGNQLSGPIPPQVAALTQLGRLDLNDNRLTGPIPPQMGALTQLFSLNLSSNQLSGPIPPQLAALFRLTTRSNWGSFPPGGLYLGGNALTGCIPLGLGDVLENDFDTLRIPFCGAEYTAQCSNGIAVPNPQDNHRLVADCTALLHGRGHAGR